MLRLSKITDYGALILRCLANSGQAQLCAREVATKINIGLPTVSKILKMLVADGLVSSSRGSQGGYQLAYAPNDIRMIDVIEALQGKVALTECATTNSSCTINTQCSLRCNWQVVNDVVVSLLSSLTLADMVGEVSPNQILERMVGSLTT